MIMHLLGKVPFFSIRRIYVNSLTGNYNSACPEIVNPTIITIFVVETLAGMIYFTYISRR